jgi:hypothetical protein
LLAVVIARITEQAAPEDFFTVKTQLNSPSNSSTAQGGGKRRLGGIVGNPQNVEMLPRDLHKGLSRL